MLIVEEVITYEMKVNIYFKRYIGRAKMDLYNIGKANVILKMLWLVAHNSKINWKTKKVKIMRYLAICEQNIKDLKKNEDANSK